MSLAGKVAVVTGSATSIGQGVAVALAKQGVRVVVTYHSTPAEETKRMIDEVGGTAIYVKADFGSRESIRNLFAETAKAFGERIDILVNNAAIQPNHWLLEYTEAEYDQVMRVNLQGYWRCIQEVLPYMKNSPCGRIINVASIHAKRPTNFDVVYAMSKGGIKMLTREAALALGKYGITVNTLTIGAIKVKSKSGNPSWKRPVRPASMRNRPAKGFLSGRVGNPEDVAYLVSFLASEESQYMTGSAIRSDGGALMI